MSPLLLRELRRLAPYGLGSAALILAAFPASWAGGARAEALACAALLGPAVLGVATVAPDSSSGGGAFLARLPLAPWRVLLAKLGAALTWTGALHLIARAVVGSLWEPDLDGAGTALTLGQLCAFGVGCLASMVAPRVMPAILLAPSLAVVSLLVLLGLPLAAWRIDPEQGLALVAVPGLGVACLLAAAVTFLRGECHRPSGRPALIAAALLVPALVLGVGATGVARAWTVEAATPDLKVGPTLGVAALEYGLVAVPLQGRNWTGRDDRVALLSFGMGGESAAVVPLRGVAGPELSPDGQRLLLRATQDPGGWLVDLQGRGWARLPGLAPEGFGFSHLVWRAGRPLLLRQRGAELEAFLPDPAAAGLEPADLEPWLVRAPLGGRRLVAALLDGRIALAGAEGLVAVDPPVPDPSLGGGQRAALPAGVTLFTWEGAGEAAVSPRARAALRVPPEEPTTLEVLLPVQAGQPARRLRGLSQGALDLSRERLSWSPEERHVALQLPDGSTAVIDVSTAALRARLSPARGTVGVEPSAAGPVVWSPSSEAWVALPSGELLDLRTGATSVLPVPVAAGLGDERFVPFGVPLRRVLQGSDRVKGGAR